MDVIAWGPVIQQGGLLAVCLILLGGFIGLWQALRKKWIVPGWLYDEALQREAFWRGLFMQQHNVNAASAEGTRILAEHLRSEAEKPEVPDGVD